MLTLGSGIRLAARQTRWRVPANVKIWRRGDATTSREGVDKTTIEKLPLAEIRVLDMTRVLAGVGNFPFEMKRLKLMV
jgi:hypothetical protein